MTIGELATLICADVGDTDSRSVSFCTSQISRKYEILYSGHNWQEAVESAIITPVWAGTGHPVTDVYLPSYVGRLLNVKFSSNAGTSFSTLEMRERDWIDKYDSVAYMPTQTGGSPRYYYTAKATGFPFTPATVAAGITITPQVTTAQIITVLIEGVDANGGYLSESFSITGLTPVTGVIRFNFISNISLSTNADVVLRFSNGVALQTVDSQIGGGTLRFTHLVIWPGYDGNQQIKVLYKLRIDRISNAMSIPRISSLMDALYYFARGAMYGRQKQKDLEAADYTMANTLFEAAKKAELEQAGMKQQIVPVIFDDPGSIFDDNDAW